MLDEDKAPQKLSARKKGRKIVTFSALHCEQIFLKCRLFFANSRVSVVDGVSERSPLFPTNKRKAKSGAWVLLPVYYRAPLATDSHHLSESSDSIPRKYYERGTPQGDHRLPFPTVLPGSVLNFEVQCDSGSVSASRRGCEANDKK